MELQHLKDIAVKLGYKHHHNIGADKLEELLKAYCIEVGTTIEEVSEVVSKEQNTLESPEQTSNEPSVINENKIENKSVKNDNKDLIEKLSKLTFKEVEGSKAKIESNQRLKEAMKLIRCTITCNNKNKTSYQGEIFCARNAKIPEVKKFIPFGVPTHIPQILFNMIKEKEYQAFRKEKINGNMITKPYMMPEYNIQLLPALTKTEIEAIKQKQLAEGFDGE